MSTQRVVRFQVALETISSLPSYPSHYLLQPASPSAHQSSRTKFLQRLVRYLLNWFLFPFSRHAITPFVVVNSRSCLFRFFVFCFLVGILLVCNKLAKNTLPISAIIHLTHTLALTFVLLLATTATTHTAYANASSPWKIRKFAHSPLFHLHSRNSFLSGTETPTPHRVIQSLTYSLASTTPQRSSNGQPRVGFLIPKPPELIANLVLQQSRSFLLKEAELSANNFEIPESVLSDKLALLKRAF